MPPRGYSAADFAQLSQEILASLNDPRLTEEVSQELDRLKKYSTRKKITVALAGGYNAGKSTFANALLDTDLLVEDVLPTTATATFIVAAPEICVLFDTPDGKSFDTRDGLQRINAFFKRYGAPAARTVEEVLSTATSNNDISRHLTSVTLGLPGRPILDLVNFIDMPGFDPGGEELDYHRKVAGKVLAEYVDLVLFLSPVNQLFPASFFSFVKDYVSPQLLQRCLFIVSKADLTRTPQEKLLAYSKKQLKDHLKLSDPQIFVQSPLLCRNPKEQRWNAELNKFLSYFYSYTQSCGKAIREETTRRKALHIAQRLQEALSQAQQMQEQQLKKTRNAPDELKKLLSACNARLGEKVDFPIPDYREYLKKIKTFADAHIGNCSPFEARAVLNTKVREEAIRQIEAYAQEIQERMNLAMRGYETPIRLMDEQMAQTYGGKTVFNHMRARLPKLVDDSIEHIEIGQPAVYYFILIVLVIAVICSVGIGALVIFLIVTIAGSSIGKNIKDDLQRRAGKRVEAAFEQVKSRAQTAAVCKENLVTHVTGEIYEQHLECCGHRKDRKAKDPRLEELSSRIHRTLQILKTN